MHSQSPSDPIATIRFYGALNDFLSPQWRHKNMTFKYQDHQSVKDVIESLGVPHPEIQLILVNGQPAGFDHKLKPGIKISAYPFFHTIDVDSLNLANPKPYIYLKFILDVHLGKLARYLRFAGFDAILLPFLEDHEIVTEANRQDRIILTRDLGLLKIKSVTFGYWLRSQNPEKQFLEVVRHFNIRKSDFSPWKRCSLCNSIIHPIEKQDIESTLRPGTREHFHEFYQCENCGKVYWKGSHFERLDSWLHKIMNRLQDT